MDLSGPARLRRLERHVYGFVPGECGAEHADTGSCCSLPDRHVGRHEDHHSDGVFWWQEPVEEAQDAR